ncbi:hypothetical protein, partial [Streptomyces sp. NPDC060210]|uniref:hypothetical protein n=1 Tax=Streptomyces sp. NPDC060210 TaxID=3347074 RepID=UPI0036679C8C
DAKRVPTGDLGHAVSRFHVICGDSRWPTSIQQYQRDVAVDRVRYPMLIASSPLRCAPDCLPGMAARSERSERRDPGD